MATCQLCTNHTWLRQRRENNVAIDKFKAGQSILPIPPCLLPCSHRYNMLLAVHLEWSKPSLWSLGWPVFLSIIRDPPTAPLPSQKLAWDPRGQCLAASLYPVSVDFGPFSSLLRTVPMNLPRFIACLPIFKVKCKPQVNYSTAWKFPLPSLILARQPWPFSPDHIPLPADTAHFLLATLILVPQWCIVIQCLCFLAL